MLTMLININSLTLINMLAQRVLKASAKRWVLSEESSRDDTGKEKDHSPV